VGGSAPRKTLSLKEIKERDALVTGCVRKLRMTAQQIADFSRMWEHPFYDERDVWRRVKALKLDRRIKRVASQSLHEEWTLKVFLKLSRDAVRNGIPVYEIAKEFKIGEESGIRADMRYRFGKFLFYQETQRPGLTYQGLKAKFKKWVRYRRKPGVRPFRVLVVMEDERNLNTALQYAREVMEPYPNLTLFLFAYMPDLLGQYDTIKEDVWRSHRYEPLSLM